LCREIGIIAEAGGLSPRTEAQPEFGFVWFSGGASFLSLDQLYRLIQCLYDRVRIAPEEQTLTVEPGTVDAARAKVLRESGFDRVVLPAARNPRADSAVLREAGFGTVGIELGYEGSAERMAASLDRALALDPDHVTLVLPESRSEEFGLLQAFRFARERLGTRFRNYALHHFCRPGHEWGFLDALLSGRPRIGVGPGTATRTGEDELHSDADAARYLSSLRGHKGPERTTVPAALVSTRNDLARLAGVDARQVNREKSREFLGRGLLESREGRLFLTDQGVLHFDRLCRELAAG
jgi:coproporphyrinogen III oxidase-like Fe-S oxidoreductase